MTRSQRLLHQICFSLIGAAMISGGHASASEAFFDVVSIKPSSGSGPRQLRTGQHGEFDATGVPVEAVIEWAYGLKGFCIVDGPGWLRSSRFDIHAKVDTPENTTIELLQARLRNLLAERFKMKSHMETRNLHVYLLQVDNEGHAPPVTHEGDCVVPDMSKALPKAAPGQLLPCGIPRIAATAIDGFGLSLNQLIPILEDRVERPVVDRTNLSQRYNVHLKWSPDPSPPAADNSLGHTTPPEVLGPSLFNALREQLGLRLQASTAPTRVLVVEQLELPSDN